MNTLEKTLKIVKNQTSMNFHNEAILTIAKYAQLPKYIKSMEAIIVLHEAYNHMPQQLRELRDDMMFAILSRMDEKEANKFRKVL